MMRKCSTYHMSDVPRKFVRQILCFLVFGVGSTSFADAGPGFSDILRREASLFVFGNEDVRESFVERLVENDSHGLVAHRGFTTDLAKADVFVFLLEKWSDVIFAPWQAELAPIYEELDTQDPATRSVTFTTTLNGDDVQFVFYKVSRVEQVPIKCFALDRVAWISREPYRRLSIGVSSVDAQQIERCGASQVPESEVPGY